MFSQYIPLDIWVGVGAVSGIANALLDKHNNSAINRLLLFMIFN